MSPQAAESSERTATFSLTDKELNAMTALFRFFWHCSFEEEMQKSILTHLNPQQVFHLGIIYSELMGMQPIPALLDDDFLSKRM